MLAVDDLDFEETRFEFTDILGSPVPVKNKVIGNDRELAVATVDLRLAFRPFTVLPYIRGDCNNDGLTNIADGIFMLLDLFQDGASNESCFSSCDSNDDKLFDQTDAIYMFNYQFSLDDGPQPPAPFPFCGRADDGEEICLEQTSCE